MLRFRNKKAQIGATMTWIIATLVIVGILLIFIYISVLMSKTKAVSIGDLKADSDEADALALKTSFAHQLAGNKNKEVIDNFIKEKNEK